MKRFCMHILHCPHHGLRSSIGAYLHLYYSILLSNGCFRWQKVRITRLYNTIHAYEYTVTVTCVQQKTMYCAGLFLCNCTNNITGTGFDRRRHLMRQA
jgi:hypothetical protein